jgi:predicted metal-binding protein
MDGTETKTCNSCKHCSGYRCKSEHIATLASLVIGVNMTGADGDTFAMRLSESACGTLGNWWEPIASPT